MYELLAGTQEEIYELRETTHSNEFVWRVGQEIKNKFVNARIISIELNENWLKILGVRRYEAYVQDLDDSRNEFMWKHWENKDNIAITYRKPTEDDNKEMLEYLKNTK